jgi:hypothetical protein
VHGFHIALLATVAVSTALALPAGAAAIGGGCSLPPVDFPPTAEFTSAPGSGQDVHYNASTSQPGQHETYSGEDCTPSDIAIPIVSYAWDFGDGTAGTGVHPTHSYLSGGAYDVTLVVDDGKPANNTAQVMHSVVVADSIAPETTIDSGPSGSTTNSQPTFAFHSSEPLSTFMCSIDQGTPSFTPCSGPGATDAPAVPLANGSYTFRVEAIDHALLPDPTPATQEFAVAPAFSGNPSPSVTPTPKKCKKGRKLKRGKCVKKRH